jgi:hypothetical protein
VAVTIGLAAALLRSQPSAAFEAVPEECEAAA